MDVIGHRGCAGEFPENTLAAVHGASPHVDAIEIDVRRCGSGELVVFHDERVDRLTDATGRIAELDYDQLAALTIGDSTESIPILADVLAACPASVWLNIELKTTGLTDRLLDAVDETPQEILVSSFEPAALAPLETEDVPTALLFAEDLGANLEQASTLGCAAVHPQHSLIDADDIARAHNRKVTVNAWTVPTAAEVQRLRGGGIDGVIVDSWRIVGSGSTRSAP